MTIDHGRWDFIVEAVFFVGFLGLMGIALVTFPVWKSGDRASLTLVGIVCLTIGLALWGLVWMKSNRLISARQDALTASLCSALDAEVVEASQHSEVASLQREEFQR